MSPPTPLRLFENVSQFRRLAVCRCPSRLVNVDSRRIEFIAVTFFNEVRHPEHHGPTKLAAA